MRSGRIFAVLFAGTALFLNSTRGLAAESDSAAGAPAIRERVVDGVFDVEGTFEVAASAGEVWSVLSDYEQIARFVSSMRRSVVRERTEHGLLVEQLAVGKLLFFSREMRVLLQIQEREPHLIQFKDVSRKDFEQYHGQWNITDQSGRTKVVYRLTAKPKTSLPDFLGSSVFQASATELLAEVRAEIVRRAARRARETPGASVPTDTAAEGKK